MIRVLEDRADINNAVFFSKFLTLVIIETIAEFVPFKKILICHNSMKVSEK